MALILSAFLHLGLIFWPSFHPFQFDPSEKGAQILLQATIGSLPNSKAPQIANDSRRTQVSADRAPQRASAQRGKSTSQRPPKSTASVELGKPANSESEKTHASSESEAVRNQTQADALKDPPLEEKPEQASAGPENREATFVEDAQTPVYPSEAIQRELESCVLAAVYVSPSGEVQAVRILHAEVTELFDQSVIDAHRAARYLPARQHGQNLPSRVLAVVTFVLEPDHVRNCAFKYAPAARKINALPVAAEIGSAMVEEALRATP